MMKRKQNNPLTHRPKLALALAIGLVAALPSGLQAQELSEPMTPPPATPPAPPKCDLPEHRQFDFWIGEWEVTNPDGTLAGVNIIEKVLDGCVLNESWTGASGAMRGHSYNIYSRAKGVWHQTWVDTTGNLLEIEGGIVDGKMVLEGDGIGQSGQPIRHRITWTPNDDGSVRQHWQVTADGGESWNDAFDGLYKKKTQ